MGVLKWIRHTEYCELANGSIDSDSQTVSAWWLSAWWLSMPWRLFGARASAITMMTHIVRRISGASQRNVVSQSLMVWLKRRFSKTTAVIMVWKSNHIPHLHVDVITYPWPKLSAGLVKLLSKWGHSLSSTVQMRTQQFSVSTPTISETQMSFISTNL